MAAATSAARGLLADAKLEPDLGSALKPDEFARLLDRHAVVDGALVDAAAALVPVKEGGRADLFRKIRRDALRRVADQAAAVRDAAEAPGGDAEDALVLAAELAEFSGCAHGLQHDRVVSFRDHWEKQRNLNLPPHAWNDNEDAFNTVTAPARRIGSRRRRGAIATPRGGRLPARAATRAEKQAVVVANMEALCHELHRAAGHASDLQTLGTAFPAKKTT